MKTICKHIPNTITCLNLVSGAVAVAYAFEGLFPMAFLFIVIGAVFDFFDGMTARLLHVSSSIGKELDSLADDITFGLAPASIVYNYLCAATMPAWLDPVSSMLPYLAFIIAAFSALRLAKFNLDERQTTSFIGLPTPANALFWASLIVGGGDWIEQSGIGVYLILALVLLTSWLLVAELPMFALKFKSLGWRGNEIKYIFVITCIPMLAFLGALGFAVVMSWYVVLSMIAAARGESKN